MIDVTVHPLRIPCMLALLLPALAARPDEGTRPQGTIQADDARVEVLSERIPVGKRIDLPEGWYRVEEEGIEDEEVGSFSIVPSATSDQAATASPAPAAVEPPPAVAAPAGPVPVAIAVACRRERSAYLRELWRASGIEVSDPDALIEGLDAGSSGPATGYYWFALETDAFRNLAWSSDLRERARELSRCVQSVRDRS